jgi:hypothetical protein
MITAILFLFLSLFVFYIFYIFILHPLLINTQITISRHLPELQHITTSKEKNPKRKKSKLIE